MKTGRILGLLAVATLISFGSVIQAQDNKPAAEYSIGVDRIARMEQIIDSFANAKQFMGDVLVAEDGRVVLDKSYGFANVEWQVPNTRNRSSGWARLRSSSRRRRSCCWNSRAS
jgi:CubicO group peptidase (beta-lactamase class C family)